MPFSAPTPTPFTDAAEHAWAMAFEAASGPMEMAGLDDPNERHGSYGLRCPLPEHELAVHRPGLIQAFERAWPVWVNDYNHARQAHARAHRAALDTNEVSDDNSPLVLSKNVQNVHRRRMVNGLIDALRVGLLPTVAYQLIVTLTPQESTPASAFHAPTTPAESLDPPKLPLTELLAWVMAAITTPLPDDRPTQTLPERLTWALDDPVAQQLWSAWQHYSPALFENDRIDAMRLIINPALGSLLTVALHDPTLIDRVGRFVNQAQAAMEWTHSLSDLHRQWRNVARTVETSVCQDPLWLQDIPHAQALFEAFPHPLWTALRHKLNPDEPLAQWILEHGLDQAQRDPNGELAAVLSLQAWTSLDRPTIERLHARLPDVVRYHVQTLNSASGSMFSIFGPVGAPHTLAHALMLPRGAWARKTMTALGVPLSTWPDPTQVTVAPSVTYTMSVDAAEELVKWLSNHREAMTTALLTLIVQHDGEVLRRTLDAQPCSPPRPLTRARL